MRSRALTAYAMTLRPSLPARLSGNDAEIAVIRGMPARVIRHRKVPLGRFWVPRGDVFLRRQEPSPAVRTGFLPAQEHGL